MAVGFKPAGGIRTARQSLDGSLMKEELGDRYVRIFFFMPAACSLTSNGN
jgi:hypothetical protein